MFNKKMIIPIVDLNIDISVDEYDFGNGFFIVNKEFDLKEKFGIFKDRKGYNRISDSRLFNADNSTKWFKALYKTKNFDKGNIDRSAETILHILITLIHIVEVTPLYPSLIILDFSMDAKSWKNVGIRSMTSQFYLAEEQIKPNYCINLEHLDSVEQMFKNIYKHITRDFMIKNRILRSITFYKHAVETFGKQLRFLNYTIALESLFSTSKDEIRYRISQRAAWLLGKNTSDKIDIFSNVKRIYDLRSTIVHGGALKQKRLESLDEQIILLENYLRLSYLKILTDDKLMDVFLDNEKIDKYFQDIMFS